MEYLELIFEREQQSVSSEQLLMAIAEEQDISLSLCKITGKFDISSLMNYTQSSTAAATQSDTSTEKLLIKIAPAIVIENCTFEDDVIFSGPWSDPEKTKTSFSNKLSFNGSVFNGQGRFQNAVFGDSASFDGCHFKGITTFKNATFEKDINFRTTVFDGYSLFMGALFSQVARFTNAHFVKGVNFAGAKFNSTGDFDGVYTSSKAIPKFEAVGFGNKKYGEDESFWRLVKQSAQEAGHYQLAGECFYRERCALLAKKMRPWTPALHYSVSRRLVHLVRPLRYLPELLFGKLLFGYGERPVRVLIAAAMVILVCAIVYSNPGWIAQRDAAIEESFLQSLYFSTITFTTLGYGDLYPVAIGPARYVAMAEAIAGSCLTALFIVCLAKKFSRG